MSELRLCEACERHIRESESRCPFCAHAVLPAAARRSTASVLFAVAAAATVAACYGAPQRNMQQAPTPQQPAPQPPTTAGDGATSSAREPSIGEARMLADGTLELELTGDDLRDSTGAGTFRYPAVHPQYESILAHVGPIRPGQRRPVRAF